MVKHLPGMRKALGSVTSPGAGERAVLHGHRLRKDRNTAVTETDLITQFLWQFFVFFFKKRSKSQGLDIRQLVSTMPRQLFLLFVHDCYPSQIEMQSNLKDLILCNSVFIPAIPLNNFNEILILDLYSLQSVFLGNFLRECNSIYKNQLVLLNTTTGGGGSENNSESRRVLGI